MIGTAQLDVGLDGHRVLRLGQRVQKLVYADGRAGRVALLKVVALQHPRHRVRAGQLNHVAKRHGLQPLRVVHDARLFGVENLRGLLEIRPPVFARLLKGERRARLGAATWVANHPGEVANDEHGLMPQVLKLPQLAEHHRMPDVEIGTARVAAELNSQGRAGSFGPLQLFHEGGLRHDVFHPTADLL